MHNLYIIAADNSLKKIDIIARGEQAFENIVENTEIWTLIKDQANGS